AGAVIVEAVGKHPLLISSCRIPDFIAYRELHEQVQVKVSVPNRVGKTTNKVRLGIADDCKIIICNNAVVIHVPVVHITSLDALLSPSFWHVGGAGINTVCDQAIESADRLAFTKYQRVAAKA